MSKKPAQEKTVRISQNPVSGKLESVVLDAVQKGYEAVAGAIDREMMKLSVADGRRMVRRLLTLVRSKLPHTDGQMEEFERVNQTKQED